jgi:predicted DNA-binding protein with PD1-like motif
MNQGENSVVVERGRFGRIVTARLRPNVDLVEGIERICVDNDISHAEIRGCVGSVMDAVLKVGSGESARRKTVPGPGLEIALTTGEVRPDADGHPRARLFGLIANWDSDAFAGEFVRGENLTFVTLELVLQEWLPE